MLRVVPHTVPRISRSYERPLQTRFVWDTSHVRERTVERERDSERESESVDEGGGGERWSVDEEC